MGLLAANTPTGGGACKNSVTPAAMRISASDRRSARVKLFFDEASTGR